jgi:hypothetical protein
MRAAMVVVDGDGTYERESERGETVDRDLLW